MELCNCYSLFNLQMAGVVISLVVNIYPHAYLEILRKIVLETVASTNVAWVGK
jgi:hypothetical protein